MDTIKELEQYKALLDEGAITETEFRRLKQKLLGLKTDEEKELERQKERAAALAEIEKMRAEEAARQAQAEQEQREKQAQQAQQEKQRQAQQEAERAAQQPPAPVPPEKPVNPQTPEKPQPNRQNEQQAAYEQTLAAEKAAEKAKELARLEAQHEMEQKKKKEQLEQAKKVAKAATGNAVTIALWGITVFCVLLALICLLPSAETTTPADMMVFGVFLLIFAALACPALSAKLRQNEKLAQNWKYKKFLVLALLIVMIILIGIL